MKSFSLKEFFYSENIKIEVYLTYIMINLLFKILKEIIHNIILSVENTIVNSAKSR